MQLFRAKISEYLKHCWDRPYGKEEREEDEQFDCLANFQFSTLAMLFCEFDSLVGYKTTG